MADTGFSPGDSLLDRFRAGVCRRAFSSPEAFGYEALISPAVFSVARPVVDSLSLEGRLLDVGCGGGDLATHLSGATRVVVGLDPSSSQTRRLAHKAKKRIATFAVQASAGQMPVATDSFDGVVTCCALKHWPDPPHGMRECARVLRPGGMILVIEVDGAASVEVFERFTHLTRVPPGLRGAYTRFAMRTVVAVAPRADEVGRWLVEADFEDIEFRPLPGMPFLAACARAT